MSATTRDKLEFVYAMAKHSTATLSDCQRLMRYAVTLHRLAEHHCNGTCPSIHDTDPTGELCRKQIATSKNVQLACSRAKVTPKFSNDPRGAVLKIVVPDGYTNDFGQEGICVPS